MDIPAHLEKLDRFEELIARLDPVEDFELWIWVLMTAGTSALNAALHAARITSDRDCYPVRPNKYMVRGKAPGTWEQQVGPLGDLLHVDVPKLEAAVSPDLARALEAMRTIERYRDPCVRGDHPITKAVADECQAAYRTCIDLSRAAVAAGAR